MLGISQLQSHYQAQFRKYRLIEGGEKLTTHYAESSKRDSASTGVDLGCTICWGKVASLFSL